MAGNILHDHKLEIPCPYDAPVLAVVKDVYTGAPEGDNTYYASCLFTTLENCNVSSWYGSYFRLQNGMLANGTFSATLQLQDTGRHAIQVAFLQLDLDGTSSGGVTKKKIKFSLKLMSSTTTQYEAEEGMTWEQWVNSSYNTDGFFIRTYSSRLELVDKTQNWALTITSTDTITADKTYTMGPAMGDPVS